VTGIQGAPGDAQSRGTAAGGSRIAVVTGAAGGIGAAICRRLARDGFALACLDLREAEVQQLALGLPGSVGYGVDVRDPGSVHGAGEPIVSPSSTGGSYLHGAVLMVDGGVTA
jgi:NAD(P)-dependent dehydrogenase (short-subunit alcohol dehydrogenase family)